MGKPDMSDLALRTGYYGYGYPYGGYGAGYYGGAYGSYPYSAYSRYGYGYPYSGAGAYAGYAGAYGAGYGGAYSRYGYGYPYASTAASVTMDAATATHTTIRLSSDVAHEGCSRCASLELGTRMGVEKLD